MKPMDIYMCGVGGQGIGMLAEVLSRACMDAGHVVNGCDTHGLAQRGGTVSSHLRLGADALTPRVPEGEAHLVLALERLEALRGADTMLRQGGTVAYYDVEYQPIHVRTGAFAYPTSKALEHAVSKKSGSVERVFLDPLPDPRMQNVALLGRLAAIGVIEGITIAKIKQTLKNSLPAIALEQNLEILERAAEIDAVTTQGDRSPK